MRHNVSDVSDSYSCWFVDYDTNDHLKIVLDRH